MPLYEVKCQTQNCELENKVVMRVVKYYLFAKGLVLCDSCGEPVERLISSGSFNLKGSDWYKWGRSGRS